ncbi:hypothetical protein CC79DRAFT_1335115 [Sarocladium strictum]
MRARHARRSELFSISHTMLMLTMQVLERGTEELPLGKLEWSGSLYPGGPVVEYAGDDLDV